MAACGHCFTLVVTEDGGVGQPPLLFCNFKHSAQCVAALRRHHLELIALPANVLDQPMRALPLVRLEVGPLARDVAVVAGLARALEVSLASTARAAVGVHLLAWRC